MWMQQRVFLLVVGEQLAGVLDHLSLAFVNRLTWWD